jgi:hypothetical protein
MTPQLPKKYLRRCTLLSVGFLAVGLAPVPGGTQLQQALTALKPGLERSQPGVCLELRFQGSQTLANNFIWITGMGWSRLDPRQWGNFRKTSTWRIREQKEPFDVAPQPIAKTILVGIAWPERGRRWAAIGGRDNWGSFDVKMTDPLRSNSGLLTLETVATAVVVRRQVSPWRTLPNHSWTTCVPLTTTGVSSHDSPGFNHRIGESLEPFRGWRCRRPWSVFTHPIVSGFAGDSEAMATGGLGS